MQQMSRLQAQKNPSLAAKMLKKIWWKVCYMLAHALLNLAWQMHGRFWTDSRQLSLENLPMITLLMVTWPLGGDESRQRKSQTNRLSSSLLW